MLFKFLEEKKIGKYKFIKNFEIIEVKFWKKRGLSFLRNNWFIIWVVVFIIVMFGYFILYVYLVSRYFWNS